MLALLLTLVPPVEMVRSCYIYTFSLAFKLAVHSLLFQEIFRFDLRRLRSCASISEFQIAYMQIKHTHRWAIPNISPPSSCFIRSLHDLPQKPAVWSLENNIMPKQFLQLDSTKLLTHCHVSKKIQSLYISPEISPCTGQKVKKTKKTNPIRSQKQTLPNSGLILFFIHLATLAKKFLKKNRKKCCCDKTSLLARAC